MPVAPLMAIDADWLNRDSDPRAGILEDIFGKAAPPFSRMGSVAVVDVVGGLAQRASWLYQGYDEIQTAFAAALADPQSDGVILRLNSPGGVCAGCFEAAREMRQMADASGKPVVAYVDEMAYSAAYALATVADEIILPKSGGVGSVGVIAQSVDYSRALDNAGIRIAVVASGAHKTDSHPAVPLTDAALGRLREEVAHLASLFFDQVAERRGMKAEAVKALQAGCFLGQKGVDVGLADAVGTFADAVNKVQGLAKGARENGHMTKKAEASVDSPAAEITPEPTMTVSAHNAALDAERAKLADGHNKTVAALQASLDAMAAEKASLAAMVEEFQAKAAKLDESRIEAKVDSFVGTKLTTAERESWLSLAKSNEGMFDTLIAGRPDLGVLGGRIAPETSGNAPRHTDAGAKHAEFEKLVDAKVKAGASKADAMVKVLQERPDLSNGTEGLQMASAIPAADRVNGNQLTHVFGLKSGDAFVKGQLVQFTSGSSTEVTSVTSANSEAIMGIYRGDSATAASGDTAEIILLCPGEIRWLINGGTTTAGARLACEGNDGRVTDVGATPASGSVIGIALASSSTDGNYVPVLIAPH